MVNQHTQGEKKLCTKTEGKNIIHLFTGYEWNSSFIQAEARTIPRGLTLNKYYYNYTYLL